MQRKLHFPAEAGEQRLRLVSALLAFLMAISNARLARAAVQEKQASNPLAGDASAVEAGRSLFRINCSFCHGFDGRGGGKGPDLTSGRWLHGGSDAAIFRTVTHGVPGTEMPANDLTEEETWMVISYLRRLTAKSGAPLAGNCEDGQKIFWGKESCSQCHMVNGKGGRLGPDLSRIGASRSTPYLIDAIRKPDKDLAEGMMEPNMDIGFPVIYDSVTVITQDGRRITGVAKNEDTFSLQLMDQGEQLHLLLKKDLKEVIHERKSLMPTYDERMLSEKELRDLLAYLDSLQGR